MSKFPPPIDKQVKDLDALCANLTKDPCEQKWIDIALRQRLEIKDLQKKLSQARLSLEDIEVHSVSPFGDVDFIVWRKYIHQIAKETLFKISEEK